MSYIDHLINDDSEEFRKHIHSALFDRIKEKLEHKKIEMASTLYDELPEEEPSE